MHLTVYEQSEIFRCAFLFGVFLGVFYDVFRLLRAAGADSQRAVFIQDIVFMSCAALLCFLFAQTTVHGRLRVFVMAGHLLGFAAYRLSAGILTGFFFKLLGALFKKLCRSFNAFIVRSAAALRRLSVNLSRFFAKFRKSQSVNDKNEKFFQQI